MSGSKQLHDSSDNVETCRSNLEVLSETYATLNGESCPLSSIRSTLYPSERPDLGALFPTIFVAAHTEFETWEELAEAAPWTLSAWEDLAEVPRHELTEFVRQTTEFDGAASFFQAAAETLVGDGE